LLWIPLRNAWTLILLGLSDLILKQTQLSISRAESRTARIECHVAVSDFGTAYLHWYRQRPGAAPERILYFSSQVQVDRESDKRKFSVQKNLNKSICILTINRISSSDIATYYCATWTGTASESH
uniref:Ig-like domain-containing protein n=1 Tax=Crocodylus porosus TaxID=8502 RepID=A0A7M4EW45_CROPO